eukprot:3118196-Pyramimonas_sp.AAC.1
MSISNNMSRLPSSRLLSQGATVGSIKSKYPVQLFLDGIKDRRSLTPLKAKAQDDLTKETTKIEAKLRLKYISKLDTACELRNPTFVRGKSWPELSDTIQEFEDEAELVWPKSIIFSIADLRQSTLSDAADWEGHLKVFRCWAPPEGQKLDLINPSFGMACVTSGTEEAIGDSLRSLLRHFVKVVYSEHVRPWIFDGISKLATLKAYALAAVKVFKDEDIWELPRDAASFIQDVPTAP